MNSLNSILIEGKVHRDAVITETPKGSKVLSFKINSYRYFRQPDDEIEEEKSCFDVEAWGKLAESGEKELLMGRGVRIVGRLKEDRWTDSEGKAMRNVKVVAEHIEYKPKLNTEAVEE